MIVTIFRNCDVIVEAFSLVENKQMLVETVLLNFPEKFLIMSSGFAGWGNSDRISQASYEKLIICGDFADWSKRNSTAFSTKDWNCFEYASKCST